MIRIKNLHKSYPIGKDSLHVLKGIDLTIEEGEFVSIMGSSGSGKSTLLNIVGLLDEHDEGDYYLNDQLIKNLNEKKAAVLRNKFLGFVFQFLIFLPGTVGAGLAAYFPDSALYALDNKPLKIKRIRTNVRAQSSTGHSNTTSTCVAWCRINVQKVR